MSYGLIHSSSISKWCTWPSCVYRCVYLQYCRLLFRGIFVLTITLQTLLTVSSLGWLTEAGGGLTRIKEQGVVELRSIHCNTKASSGYKIVFVQFIFIPLQLINKYRILMEPKGLLWSSPESFCEPLEPNPYLKITPFQHSF